MSGWRDSDGNTAADRRKRAADDARAHFAHTLRNRPLSLVKPVLGAAFVLLLVIALLLAFR